MSWSRKLRPQASKSGSNVWWPVGLQVLTPVQRHQAIHSLGAWPDGNHVVFVDGRRLYRPTEAARLRAELGVSEVEGAD